MPVLRSIDKLGGVAAELGCRVAQAPAQKGA
jgi:hypothetical protein